LQFGFKPGLSTTQYSIILSEVINHHITNGFDVYVMMLDCSKAFNRVHYSKLQNIDG
jgi:hypothetical protein